MTIRGAQYWNSGAIPLIAPDMLGRIIATLADMAVVISDDGVVLSVLANPIHASFTDLDHWEKQDIRKSLTVESVPKFDRHLSNFLDGRDTDRTIELNHHDKKAGTEFPVNYTFHRIGPEGAILMLGRDLRPIAEMQQQLVTAQLALEADYEKNRVSDARFRVLLESSPDAVVFISVGSGRITAANSSAGRLLGVARDELVNLPFAQEFSGRRHGELMEQLSETAATEGGGSVVLEARRTRRNLRALPTLFRTAGERIILCRLTAKSERDQHTDQLSRALAGLFHSGGDAMVFSNRDGVITSANEAFLELADAPGSTDFKGRSLAEFLHRGSIDLRVLLDNAARAGRMSMYATRVVGEYGGQRAVEISATYLADETHPAYAFVLRDASRADAVRVTDGPMSTASDTKSMRELVGSATLKEIVAGTTDVIEKMCIETALELTSNNRVAAADMLGLSRQSLYVKLRKFDLVEK